MKVWNSPHEGLERRNERVSPERFVRYSMNIVFIRHGDPDYSIDSLTEKGVREAELLRVRMNRVGAADYYCSPLGRARKTAEIALADKMVMPETLEWMQEFYHPVLDPKTGKRRIEWDFFPSFWTTIPELYDKDRWYQTELMQSGEVSQEYLRVTGCFDEFLKRYGYHKENGYYRAEPGSDKTVIIFCHLGIQFVLLGYLTGISPLLLWQGFFVAPTSVTMITSEERETGIAAFRCRAVGDTAHLYMGGEPTSDSGLFPRNSLTI